MNDNNMTPEQFCYWLNGHFDLSDLDALTSKQVKVIKEHLALVFNKKAKSIMDLMEDDGLVKKSPSYLSTRPLKPIC